jgi:hypothetical protein
MPVPKQFSSDVKVESVPAQFSADTPIDTSGHLERMEQTHVAPRPAVTSLDRMLAPNPEAGNADPNTLRGYGRQWGEAAKGMAAGVKGFLDPHTFPGTEGNPVIWNPVTQFKKDWQGIKEWNELRKEDAPYAWGAILSPMLLTHTVSGLLKPAGMTAKLARGAGVDPAYIEPVVNDLRMAAKGKKFESVGDFVDVASKAEKSLNQEYEDALGKTGFVRSNLPDANGHFPIATAIRMLKDRMPSITGADRAEMAYVDRAAAEYEHPISLYELDLKRMQANARLDAYYNKSDVSQYNAETKSAQLAIDKTVANWVRDNVYPDMDAMTGKPQGYFRNLKSRIGNLMNASSEAKDFAAKVHREAMTEKGSTPLERVHAGTAISASGKPHGYISNVMSAVSPRDVEASANKAVKSGFSLRQRLEPPPEALSVPLSAIVGASIVGPRTQQLIDLLNEQRNSSSAQ